MSSDSENGREKSQICEHLQRELNLLLSLNLEPERLFAARDARSRKRSRGKSVEPARRNDAERA